jgi:hypothetical protein
MIIFIKQNRRTLSDLNSFLGIEGNKARIIDILCQLMIINFICIALLLFYIFSILGP